MIFNANIQKNSNIKQFTTYSRYFFNYSAQFNFIDHCLNKIQIYFLYFNYFCPQLKKLINQRQNAELSINCKIKNQKSKIQLRQIYNQEQEFIINYYFHSNYKSCLQFIIFYIEFSYYSQLPRSQSYQPSIKMKEQQPTQIESSPPKQQRKNHQLKALMYKTATLQWKQPCTNICQVITPIICLIFTMMIRNVAIQNLSSNQDNVYNKIPLVPFKMNDFQLFNQLQEIAFSFGCNRWYLYDWANEDDAKFIGHRDGRVFNKSDGMLSNVLKTNYYNCWVNQSFHSPYFWSLKYDTPYFKNTRLSINEDLYQRYQYFNNMTIANIRHTTAVDKIPDGAVFFRQANQKKLNVDVKINDQRLFQLHGANALTKFYLKDPTNKNSSFQSYFTISQGMLSTIDMITTSYLKTITNGLKQIVSGYVYMPITGNSSVFIEMLINIISTILFPLSLSLLLPVFLYNTVLQKQTKIIQMMRMNGLGILTYWGVSFLFNFIISLVTYIIFYAFGYFIMQNAFFMNTSFFLVWIVLLGWIICQIGISMFFQVFISNSRAANIIGYLMTIWTNLIGATLSVALYQYPVEMPYYVSLWPTIAFNRIFYLMFINCSSDHCFSTLQNLPNQLKLNIFIIYLTAFIFIFAGMYLYEVIPQQFGISKKVWFPFQCLINLCRKRNRNKVFFDQHQIKQQHQIINQQTRNQSDDLVITEKKKIYQNRFLNHALICKGLTKVYDNGKKATSDFNLMIEDNQVFGLLGPNGAGKTTLISMITGIFSPTTGTAYIAGYNIQTQIDMVHMNMGVCPQFDILWQQLTVQQHLYFYARLRGISGKQENKKVKQTLQQISLQNFAKFKVNQLSGGMKRRLSVAISLVGDPRIVFLDQPTTGLDPQNRRNLWQLLSKCKNKRSLFLTTHLMQEAQSLCDRIGIITSSYLRTVGEQMELKKLYGRGYNLTLSIEVERKWANNNLQIIREDSSEYNEDDLGQQRRSQSSSSSFRENANSNRRVSFPSIVYQRSANKLINDSIDPSEQNYDYTLNNSLTNQQSYRQYSQLNAVSSKKLQILKKRILQLFEQNNCTLTKQINGTLKFNLNSSSMKVSKVLQTLQILKVQMKNLKQKRQNSPTRDLVDNQVDSIEFQWSINNSSLEDVFLNVVQKFPRNKKQVKVSNKLNQEDILPQQ